MDEDLDLDFTGLDANQIDIKLKSLYYFIIVAEVGNITKAAKRLYVTQSMLSKSIAILEKDIGISLIERQGRSFTLTAAGKYLFVKWKDIIKNFQNSMTYAEIIDHKKIEKLRLGCFPAVRALDVMQPLLKKLKQAEPQIQIEIWRMNYNRLLEHLNSDKVDVIVTLLMDLPEDKGAYTWKTFKKCPLVAAIGRENILWGRNEISVKDLEGQVILYNEPAGNLSRGSRVKRFFVERNVCPQEISPVNNDLTAVVNSWQNRGIALGIREVFDDFHEDVMLAEVKDVQLTLVIVWNKNVGFGIKETLEKILYNEI